MPVSDALVVVNDWVSEFYFTSEESSGTFLAAVKSAVKQWETDEADDPQHRSPLSRVTAERQRLLSQLIALHSQANELGEQASPAQRREALGTVSEDAAAAWRTVLGYDDLPHTGAAPLRRFTPGGMQEPWVAVIDAVAADTAEELTSKRTGLLTKPYQPEDADGEPEGDPVSSVPELLSALVSEPVPPRLMLVLAGRLALLTSEEGWPQGRYLAIDLQTVTERNDTKVGGELRRAVVALAAGSVAPDAQGGLWWEQRQAESVRNAAGVSKDLRDGVRESIEIIANEVVHRRKDQGLEPLPDDQAQVLAIQSLRYLYRILFLLYAEASPRLGILPAGDPDYTAGYSVDRLRELTLKPLTTRSERGTHFYDSLQVLFRLAQSGHRPAFDPQGTQLREGLRFEGLSSDLFQQHRTALIDEVGLGNGALQEVLRRLLLTKERKGRQRGFISYVALGINQLGAVYESLMSYTGSFARGTLVEVARHGDPSDGSWVVPQARIDAELAPHQVMVADDQGHEVPRTYQHGEFVFRLSGRQRQRSASYYSPQVLTEFTVQQGLEELLSQDLTAQDILELSVCEPALGSGAFAIEAVRQLAEAYLDRRQEELGERVDPEHFQAELQRTKAHIALHNVYGVDLNPTAVELAEVSLWLDTMVTDMKAPWFGLRLRSGNSLVGARHAVYDREVVRKATPKVRMTTAPREIPLTRSVDSTSHIFHFLLPGEGWGAAGSAKEIKTLAPQKAKALREWAKQVQKKPTPAQLKQLTALTERIDYLWGLAERRMVVAEEQSRRSLEVWGADPAPGGEVTRAEIEESLNTPGSAYQRLRLVMDAWCALWFWPVGQDDVDDDTPAPPSTDEWLAAIQDLVGSTMKTAKAAEQSSMELGQLEWGDLDARESWFSAEGTLPVERVLEQHPWLRTVRAIAVEQRFFHWELDFAAVFARGGFDFQVGNPPWVRPRPDTAALLGESDPWWALIDKPSEAAKKTRRANTMGLPGAAETLLLGTGDTVALAELIGSVGEFPELAGTQPDLYRAFMMQTWRHSSSRGHSALIHPPTHLTDAHAYPLRHSSYRRLRRHWNFINHLKLFSEVTGLLNFSVNIYGPEQSPSFIQAVSLHHPITATGSLMHNGDGPEPGFKNIDGDRDLTPHARRIAHIDHQELALWHHLMEGGNPEVPIDEARMVATLNRSAASVLEKLAQNPNLGSTGAQFSRGWDETFGRRDGYFEQFWGPAASWDDVILQGPFFHVGNPFFGSRNKTMRNKQDYSSVDLELLTANALPVTEYKPIHGVDDRGKISTERYDRDYGSWTIPDPRRPGEQRSVPVRSQFRIMWRKMADNTGERTLIPAIFPPGTATISGALAIGHPQDPQRLILTAGSMSSLLSDFLVRATVGNNIFWSAVKRLPQIPSDHPLAAAASLRILRLNTLTEAYAPLWKDCWDPVMAQDAWTGGLERPNRPALGGVGPEWTEQIPLRIEEDRRRALVEIDAITAHVTGVSIDELCTIYRTQFGVLAKYDRGDGQLAKIYDAHGRLIPTSVRTAWNKAGRPQHGLSDEQRTYTTDSGRNLVAKEPFRILDREADLREAYAAFAERIAGGSGNGTKD